MVKAYRIRSKPLKKKANTRSITEINGLKRDIIEEGPNWQTGFLFVGLRRHIPIYRTHNISYFNIDKRARLYVLF